VSVTFASGSIPPCGRESGSDFGSRRRRNGTKEDERETHGRDVLRFDVVEGSKTCVGFDLPS